jgi:O-antigen/teichoic acid export membrane protein
MFAPAQYGVVGNVYAWIAFFNIVYLYGIDTAYLKYAAMESKDNMKRNFSTPFLFVYLTSLIISLVYLLFADRINSAMCVPPKYDSVAYYTIGILFFDALSMIPFCYLRLVRKAKKFAAIKTMNISVNVALNLVLIVGMKMDIQAVFISNLVASVLTFICLLPEIISSLQVEIDKEVLIKMLKFGITYLPAGLASMVIQVIDRPILQRMTDERTVGIYLANYKMGIFMMLFVSMFQYAWQPFFLSNAKEENAKEMFSKVLTYFSLAASIIFVVLTLFIDDAIKFSIMGNTLIGREYWSGTVIIPIILLGYLFNGLYVNFTAGIFIKEKNRYVPIITGAGALTNIVVNIALIPFLGIVGAALATLLSYIVMAAGLYLVSQKYYLIEYEYIKLAKIFSLMLSCVAVYYTLFSLGALNFIMKLIMLVLFMGGIVILKIVSADEIASAKKMLIKR